MKKKLKKKVRTYRRRDGTVALTPGPKPATLRHKYMQLQREYETLLNRFNDLAEAEADRRITGEELAYARGYDAGYRESQGHLLAAAGEIRAAAIASRRTT